MIQLPVPVELAVRTCPMADPEETHLLKSGCWAFVQNEVRLCRMWLAEGRSLKPWHAALLAEWGSVVPE